MAVGPTSAAPGQPPPPRRRGRRRAIIWAVSLAAVVAILFGLDRVAAAYAENRIAQEIQSRGFPSRPDVTVQGFPFLTQLITRNLTGVDVRSSALREGPITVSLDVLATDVKLNSGYNGGVMGQVAGTGVIAFSDIASQAGAAGASGLTVSANGPDELKLTVDLPVVTATVIAKVIRAGPGTVRIRVVSAGGLPPSLLGPISDFLVQVPALPLGLTVQRVSVSAQGVVIHVGGRGVSFGR